MSLSAAFGVRGSSWRGSCSDSKGPPCTFKCRDNGRALCVQNPTLWSSSWFFSWQSWGEGLEGGLGGRCSLSPPFFQKRRPSSPTTWVPSGRPPPAVAARAWPGLWASAARALWRATRCVFCFAEGAEPPSFCNADQRPEFGVWLARGLRAPALALSWRCGALLPPPEEGNIK